MEIKKLQLKKSGFVLLYAVTLAAILLAIAIGVSNVATNEIRFSTSAKNTSNAFLAADTGIECAIFHDKSAVTVFPLDGQLPTIECAGNPNLSVSWDGIYHFVLSGLGSDGQACAKINVSKVFDSSSDTLSTTIVSQGYNVGDPVTCEGTQSNRVERELQVMYFAGNPSVSTSDAFPSVQLSADSTNIFIGESTDLHWTYTGNPTPVCTASSIPTGWSGTKTPSGGSESTGALETTTTFTLTCENSLGAASDFVTVNVSNAPTYYTVTPSAGTGGSISPSTPRTVASGDTTSFTITPNAGNYISSVTGCGGSLSGNTYTTGAITSNCSVVASFFGYKTYASARVNTNSDSIRLSPSGVQAGDVMVVSIAAVPYTSSISPISSGWNSTGMTRSNTTVNSIKLATYTKVATSDDVGAFYIWSLGGSYSQAVGGMIVVSGANSVNPVVDYSSQTTSTTASTTPTVNTVVANTFVISTHAVSSSATWTPYTSGMTEAVDIAAPSTLGAAGVSLEMNYGTQASVANISRRATLSSNVDSGVAGIMIIKP
ncbi:MAG: hypothetical protein WCT29_01995 [Candidatus Paceibacterota bacterium]|jgi:hypothetical protein